MYFALYNVVVVFFTLYNVVVMVVYFTLYNVVVMVVYFTLYNMVVVYVTLYNVVVVVVVYFTLYNVVVMVVYFMLYKVVLIVVYFTLYNVVLVYVTLYNVVVVVYFTLYNWWWLWCSLGLPWYSALLKSKEGIECDLTLILFVEDVFADTERHLDEKQTLGQVKAISELNERGKRSLWKTWRLDRSKNRQKQRVLAAQLETIGTPPASPGMSIMPVQTPIPRPMSTERQTKGQTQKKKKKKKKCFYLTHHTFHIIQIYSC